MSDVIDRLSSINLLSAEYSRAVDIEELTLCEQRMRDLKLSTDVVPTIGCEVEVKWSSLFPELAKEFFGQPDKYGRFPIDYAALTPARRLQVDERSRDLDADYKPRYERTLEAGIPCGNDAYWEFANAPAYSAAVLSSEVNLLIQEGLIPKGSDHSLHITLGNVASKGGGVGLLLTGLEVLYANPLRIESATIANKYGGLSAWARRGHDGFRGREANAISLGASCASELRTLSVNDSIEVSDVFKSAQLFGAILLGFRQRDYSYDVRVLELAKLWREFRSLSRLSIEAAGLPLESWGKPHENREKWMKWADFIAQRNEGAGRVMEIIVDISALETRAAEILEAY